MPNIDYLLNYDICPLVLLKRIAVYVSPSLWHNQVPFRVYKLYVAVR